MSGWLLCAALLAMWSGATEAARPATIELRSKSGALGSLTQTALGEGGVYVSAERLAALLKGTWKVKGSRGTLTVGSRSASFTQNQSRITLLGAPVTLQSPPRVGSAGWLLPDDFLGKGLAKLAPGVMLVRVAAAAPKPPPRPQRPSVAFEDLRLRSYPSFTRVVIETAGAIPYTVEASRDEVRVRLAGLGLQAPQAQEVDDGLVDGLRLAPANGDAVLRVALASRAGEVKDFTLQDPPRIVIDIHRPKQPAGPDGAGPGMEPLRLIVLDAGHGGHDPGAVGPSGLQEKEVVLDVTRRVARMAEDGLGVKVALTRSTDVFIPLRERTNFANKQRADLFVSIHANAHPRAVSEGVETYFLSSEASDTEARQVAAIENGAVQLETPASRQKTDLLRSILWDLAQSEFQQESSFLAETVQDSMTQSMRLVNRGVKQAGFYVLGGAAMPAILVEIGFLTNPREERKLATSEYREAAARAIYAGLSEYKRRWDQRMRTAQAARARAERTPPPR
ncbi:MAG: N-acetylmuramoyl-L-alanine amidase [Candidatus Rokubacteria bacterium]|nr:N-acetylmuramoyl-L-alanine amidase [Candidatus Rokubacteria bacterium]